MICILSQAGSPDGINKLKVTEMCSIALLQICYNFFTYGLDMLTGKNVGDIINLNSEGRTLLLLMKVVRRVGL